MGHEEYLRGMISAYYRSTGNASVGEIASREFGIGDLGKKISMRHLSFRNDAQLNSFLREKAPFYISCSCGLYEFADARPMEAKKLLGADLIYEFDADDIKTPCKMEHDSWKCTNKTCVGQGKGNLKECPECGSGTNVDEWVCPQCLEVVKDQSKRLLKLLENDFGFTSGIATNFSGSKGYHIHVRGEAVRSLSKAARLELLDYITATNVNLRALGFDFAGKTALCPKRASAAGWAGTILDGIEQMLDSGDKERLCEIGRVGLAKKGAIGTVERLLKEKPGIISSMGRGLFPYFSGVKPTFWQALAESVLRESTLQVDRQTSVDINKIIRVPNTIHGSTGLLAKEFPVSEIDSFNPLKDSVVLAQKEVALTNVSAPKFSIGGKWFGPFNNENVSLPSYAAFWLLARGSANMDGN